MCFLPCFEPFWALETNISFPIWLIQGEWRWTKAGSQCVSDILVLRIEERLSAHVRVIKETLLALWARLRPCGPERLSRRILLTVLVNFGTVYALVCTGYIQYTVYSANLNVHCSEVILGLHYHRANFDWFKSRWTSLWDMVLIPFTVNGSQVNTFTKMKPWYTLPQNRNLQKIRRSVFFSL